MQSEIRQIIFILIPWIYMTFNFWLFFSNAVFPGHTGTRSIFPQINYKMKRIWHLDPLYFEVNFVYQGDYKLAAFTRVYLWQFQWLDAKESDLSWSTCVFWFPNQYNGVCYEQCPISDLFFSQILIYEALNPVYCQLCGCLWNCKSITQER